MQIEWWKQPCMAVQARPGTREGAPSACTDAGTTGFSDRKCPHRFAYAHMVLRSSSPGTLVATLPVQARRFKLRIPANMCQIFRDSFPDTTGEHK